MPFEKKNVFFTVQKKIAIFLLTHLRQGKIVKKKSFKENPEIFP